MKAVSVFGGGKRYSNKAKENVFCQMDGTSTTGRC